jgi:hypothetical protein
VLQPLGLDAAGASPQGAVDRLIRRSVDLLAYQTGTGGGGQAPRIAQSLDTVLTGIRQEVVRPPPDGAGVTAAQALALQNAILGITAFTFTLPTQDARFIQNLDAARTSLSAGFLADLGLVRQRLSASSWIDIRGCRVGQNLDYLRAVSEFFGRAGNRPHVSGPEWFQSFPTLGYRPLRDSQIPGLASQRWVRRALDHWFSETGTLRRLLWLQSLYLDLLIESRRLVLEQQDLSGIPPLVGGLRPPPDFGLVLPPIGGIGGFRPGRFQLPEPGFSTGLAPSFDLETPSIAEGVATRAEAEFERLGQEVERISGMSAADKLSYYLDQALVLPVHHNGRVSDIRLYVKHSLMDQAMDNWLNSQWSTDAPGLASLQGMAVTDQDPRRIAALSRRRSLANPGELVISPDSRYRAHIKEI